MDEFFGHPIGYIAILFFGLFAGIYLGLSTKEAQAIRAGHAYYDAKTANFTWRKSCEAQIKSLSQ